VTADSFVGGRLEDALGGSDVVRLCAPDEHSGVRR
jgi:hypothetical protein